MNALFRYARRLGRFMTLYSIGFALQLIIGLVTTVIVVHNLDPSSYGTLSLYLLVPSTLLVVSNMGLLQGTNRTVYAHAGEMMDTGKGEGASQDYFVRLVFGTGVVVSLISGTICAAVAFALAPEISSALGGHAHGVRLVEIGAVSGAMAGGWRLTSNLQRYARRPGAWGVAHTSRAAFSLVAIIVLLGAGLGLEGVIIGFAVGTLIGFVLSSLIARTDMKLGLNGPVAKDILRTAVGWIPIVLTFYVVMSLGVYFVSLSGTKRQVGLYSLAISLALPAQYLVSAFIYSWGPLTRSALRAAVVQEEGQAASNAAMFEGYTVVAAIVVMALGVFAGLFVAIIAPHSYSAAANLVPLVALTAIGRGYFMLTHALSSQHSTKRFRAMAIIAFASYIPLALLLGPALHAYGIALAGPIAFSTAAAIQFVLMQRTDEPLPLSARRVLIPIVLAAVLLPTILILFPGASLGATVVKVAVLIGFVLVLALLEIIPVRAIRRQLKPARASRMPGMRSLTRRIQELAPTDASLLRELICDARPISEVAAEREESEAAVQVRFARLLEHLGGPNGAPGLAPSATPYLVFRGPFAERDRLGLQAVHGSGVDPIALDRAEQLVSRTRRLPQRAWRRDPDDGRETRQPIAISEEAVDALSAALPGAPSAIEETSDIALDPGPGLDDQI